MLLEIELSNAREHQLYLRGGRVHFMLPVEKRSSQGDVTERTLECACRFRRQPLCPWHAAQRHLNRLQNLKHQLGVRDLPLFPGARGETLPKEAFVGHVRSTLLAAGIECSRPNEVGQLEERFQGHVLRVSGAQFLCMIGLPGHLIQMHGRWTSTSVLRYLQQAPLHSVPVAAAQALSCGQSSAAVAMTVQPLSELLSPRFSQAVGSAAGSDKSGEAREPPLKKPACQLEHAGQRELEKLRSELAGLARAVKAPAEVWIQNPRTKKVHRPTGDELTSGSDMWAARCGWPYGMRRHFRLASLSDNAIKCRRCFGLTEDGAGSDDGSEESSSSVSGSSSDL